jgi:hypothetical protein
MKSHINTAKFVKRIPTEDYAFEEYSLEAAVDASESGEDVLIEMRRQVSAAFAADLIESTERKPAEKKPAKKGKKDAKPGKTSPPDDEDEIGEDPEEQDSGDDGESPDDDEAADDHTEDDDHDSAEDTEGGEDGGGEEDEEEKPAKGKSGKTPSKETKGKKVFKKKPQAYDRSIEQHREIFSRVLRSVKPDWKSSDVLKARAKKVSETLEGEEFLDGDGEVLPEFTAEVKKRMAAKAK